MNNIRTLRGMLSLLIAFGCLLVCSSTHAQNSKLTDDDIKNSIEAIKKFLYAAQAEDGGWYGAYHTGPAEPENRNNWGPTAMATLALIVAGESPQNPKIKKALEKLAEVEITGTYALSMRAHVWSYLPQDVFGKFLSKDASTMLNTSYDNSRFNYIVYGADGFEGDHRRIDNSTTQYGVLALWQADKRGLRVPDEFWVKAVENFLDQQSANGGWTYSGNANTTQSMTLAGLTVMFVAQQELFRDQNKPNTKITESIEKGLKFLNDNFAVEGDHVHGGISYMWYGYERVGLASGIKYFGGRDWFQEIARRIVARRANYGNSIHTAAFDLMFLARGRVPVWINKLAIPGTSWNNRPNDVYFLNRFISEYREHEVNWQVVGVDSNPKEWMSAPLMWISSDGSIEWTDERVSKIKEYIDLGGTVIGNPEERSSSFRASIEELAEKMYPDLKFQPVPKDHPMANLLEGDPRSRKAPEFEILSNGARVLMIMPRNDWGMTFQKDEKPDPDKDTWRDIINIYGVVTDRGELTPRLSTPWVAKKAGAATGTIKVFIPQWEDPGGKIHEADVYRVMKNYMHNETGQSLDVQTLPLTELAANDPALLHMMGVNAVNLSVNERDAIQAFMQSGGTILIENLGGVGDFATSIRDQLSPLFPGADDTVGLRSNLITGRGLPEGAKSNREFYYRSLVVQRSNPDGRLLLRGWSKNDRYPVLLSFEDLSMGMLGVKQYGINGFSVESSRDIMLNILLDAEQAKGGG